MILGIDPSLNETGLCHVSWDGVVATKTLIPPREYKQSQYHMARLQWLNGNLQGDLNYWDTNGLKLVMFEDYAYGGMGKGYDLAEWGGLWRLMVYQMGFQMVSLSPNTLKKFACPHMKPKHVEKSNMVSAAQAYGVQTTNHNVADAALLAIAGVAWLRSKGLGNSVSANMQQLNFTQEQLNALTSVSVLSTGIESKAIRPRRR